MQRLSKWSARTALFFQRQRLTEPDAHALVVKWDKFQKEYKNRIKHFLPRVGDHPEWDTKSKAVNQGKNTQVPVHFPLDIVNVYKDYNAEYIPQTPIKQLEAELLLDILPLDVRYLLGCGYKWNAAEEEK